ncbi:hypothetical protein [Caviibacter abscessus]|uniref:hypothetical protein n=1 Tax=Caviibacter abscessus TaxID=1766719 RepID=UPI00082DB256|nr:hypothetical protein [Caviibacter abscessus]
MSGEQQSKFLKDFELKKDKEIKIGLNIGLVRDAALYSSKGDTDSTYKEATLERYAMSGELQSKFLKSFVVKRDLKVKLGAGTSIYTV